MNIRMSETSCRLLNNARTKGVAPDVEDDMQVYGCQIQRGDTVQERIRGGRTYIYSYDCKTREHVHVDRIQFIALPYRKGFSGIRLCLESAPLIVPIMSYICMCLRHGPEKSFELF